MLESVRNITTRTFPVRLDDPDSPDALVRDAQGKMVALTNSGERRYGAMRLNRNHSGFFVARPGYAYGCTLPLNEIFALDRAGKYTVLLTQLLASDFDREHGPWRLVAKPLVIEITEVTGATRNDIRWNEEIGNDNRSPSSPGSANGTQWSRLALMAGKLQRGCILEAFIPVDEPHGGKIIASLTRLTMDRVCDMGGLDFLDTLTGAAASDYDIMVRDQKGADVPLTQRGRAELAARADQDGGLLRPGDATGAAIPLKEWFSMNAPGEYSVLVSLPSRKPGGAMWVAKPIKVTLER